MAKRQRTKEEVEKAFTDKNGVIRENKLMRFLYGDSSTVRERAVLSPSVQFSELSTPSSIESSLYSVLLTHKHTIQHYSKEMWYLLHFMAITGCRVSEALQVNSFDITRDGRVAIRGLKGSLDRIVVDSECMSYLAYCKSVGKKPFGTFNRQFVWRYLRSQGLYDYFGVNSKASVTHMFRHEAVLQNKEVDTNLKMSKQQLGHKSIKSTESYAKSRRGKNNH